MRTNYLVGATQMEAIPVMAGTSTCCNLNNKEMKHMQTKQEMHRLCAQPIPPAPILIIPPLLINPGGNQENSQTHMSTNADLFGKNTPQTHIRTMLHAFKAHSLNNHYKNYFQIFFANLI